MNIKLDLTKLISLKMIFGILFHLLQKIDDPIADYAILPTFKLASVASKKFKVAITGEGGDELFGGYGRYRHHNFLKKFFKGAFRKLENLIIIIGNLKLVKLLLKI